MRPVEMEQKRERLSSCVMCQRPMSTMPGCIIRQPFLRCLARPGNTIGPIGVGGRALLYGLNDRSPALYVLSVQVATFRVLCRLCYLTTTILLCVIHLNVLLQSHRCARYGQRAPRAGRRQRDSGTLETERDGLRQRRRRSGLQNQLPWDAGMCSQSSSDHY